MSSRSGSRWTSERRTCGGAGGFLAAALVLGAALLAGCGGVASPHAAAPEFPDGPAFDHAKHLEKGVECLDCHEGADEAAKAPMPTLEICMECHEELEEDKPEEERLAATWVDEAGKPRWHAVMALPDEVIFSHASHAAKKVECTDCHEAVTKSRRISYDLRLDMQDCVTCHAERNAPGACETCHHEIGRDWKPPSHARLWMVRHGQEVRRGAAPETITDDCSTCHTETSCTSCHRAREPRDHTETWRRGGGHGLAASLDRERCQACHEEPSCIACHAEARPRSHRAGWGGRRSRHCLNCHEPLAPDSPDGCGVCHTDAPSHALAPPKPDWHRPDMECALCHPAPHADGGRDCNACHR